MKTRILFVSKILIWLSLNPLFSLPIEITPSGADDAELIQTTLDGLQNNDTLYLNGDFKIGSTIYLPSSFTWILDGTFRLDDAAVLDEVGYIDTTRNIDATRRTAISETAGGATNINMSGGTYYGNSAGNPKSLRLINFVYVTDSKFHDMVITDASDDNFTLGPGCQYNECRNLTGSFAGGNALTDKGDYNKWYDCIAEDCASDGWTPKCRNSEFYRCIGRRNLGPGFGMYVRIDGSGNPDLGETIEGNKFYDCQAYDNDREGFSFDISSTSGEGGMVRNNYVQGIAFNNRMQGVFFRNKQPNSIIENNEVNIVVWGNKGQRTDGSPSSLAGGLSVEGSFSSPVRGISGSVVAYDNTGWDVNTDKATDCDITVYHPTGKEAPVLKIGDISNKVTIIAFDCSDSLSEWCQQKYCEILAATLPAAPDSLAALTVSFRQINLNWIDNASDETGYKIERKSSGTYTEIATLATDITSYKDTGLLPSTTYTYRIRAYNIAGYSDYSNETSATTDSSSGSSFIEIIYDDFEGDSYGNWNDGGENCRVDSSEHAHQGFYSVNLESNTSSSLVTTDDLVLTGYNEVLVEFWYKTDSMEADDNFRLQISTNGGSSYSTVQTWVNGVDFENDTFYSDSVVISGYALTNQTRIRFRCHASSEDDDVYLDEIRISAGSGAVSIDADNSPVLNRFSLQQNYPNPFNPATTIEYTIPERSFVSLKVYDLLGREVAVLVHENKRQGTNKIVFDAVNISSGIYFYRLQVRDFADTKKFVLMK